MLSDLERELSDSGILVTKAYVKERQNVYSHPAVNGYNDNAASEEIAVLGIVPAGGVVIEFSSQTVCIP